MRSGRRSVAPSAVMDRDDVVDAMTAWVGRPSSASRSAAAFGSMSSTVASRKNEQAARSFGSVEMSPVGPAPTSEAAMSSARPGDADNTTTPIPASRQSRAIPEAITPVPNSPTRSPSFAIGSSGRVLIQPATRPAAVQW
jgi:hypothetical protein